MVQGEGTSKLDHPPLEEIISIMSLSIEEFHKNICQPIEVIIIRIRGVVFSFEVIHLSILLSLHNIFVSAQYLGKTLMDVWPTSADALILTTSSLGLLSDLLQSYGPWMTSEFCFSSISWERMNGFWTNFAYALILTISSLGLLSIHFLQFFSELWPLNDVRILFPFNILRKNKWILAKFCISNDIDI